MKPKTEKERRALQICAGLIKKRKRRISARIPLQPQCAHWGSFSPGEAFGVPLSVLLCCGRVWADVGIGPYKGS